MFVPERLRLIDTLEIRRKAVCVYGGGRFCDCKYRPEDPKYNSSEVSGCPELGAAVHILKAMTDEEYAYFVKIADNM